MTGPPVGSRHEALPAGVVIRTTAASSSRAIEAHVSLDHQRATLDLLNP